MRSVTTPDGKMFVAGFLRSNGAVLLDLVLALFTVQVIVGVLRVLGLLSLSDSVMPILTVLTAIPVFGYPLVLRRYGAPSFGNWALGVRVYPCSLIPEYSPRGNLVVFEPLPDAEYSRRAIVGAVVLCVLGALAFVLNS